MLAVVSTAALALDISPAPSASNPGTTLSATLPETLDGKPSIPANTELPKYVVIKPGEEVTFSSETTASVAAQNVKEGSTFRSGDILIELDCRIQQADLDKAHARQHLSQVALTSAKKLKSYDSISDFELAQATTQAAQDNAEVNKLTAVVEKCTLRAPFNGAVARLMVHTHETVKPGDPLIKIVSTENPDFETQVPSSWLSWLKPGAIFYVHVSELNRTIPVRITRINPEINSINETVKITGKSTENISTLQPGMSGQASFPGNTSSRLAVKRNISKAG